MLTERSVSRLDVLKVTDVTLTVTRGPVVI